MTLRRGLKPTRAGVAPNMNKGGKNMSKKALTAAAILFMCTAGNGNDEEEEDDDC